MPMLAPLAIGGAVAGGAGLAGMSTVGALAAGGLASSALGSIAQGQAASTSAKYNAQIATNNAQIAQQNATFAGEEGAVNAGASEQKTRAEVGSIKAAQAANGIDINSGSSVDVRSSAAELGELNAINIRSNAARQAYGYQTQAASNTAQAQLDREQAKYATEAGYIEAGTTLLGGAATGGQKGLWGNFLNNTGLQYGPNQTQFASQEPGWGS